jgi:hypothetical protein
VQGCGDDASRCKDDDVQGCGGISRGSTDDEVQGRGFESVVGDGEFGGEVETTAGGGDDSEGVDWSVVLTSWLPGTSRTESGGKAFARIQPAVADQDAF